MSSPIKNMEQATKYYKEIVKNGSEFKKTALHIIDQEIQGLSKKLVKKQTFTKMLYKKRGMGKARKRRKEAQTGTQKKIKKLRTLSQEIIKVEKDVGYRLELGSDKIIESIEKNIESSPSNKNSILNLENIKKKLHTSVSNYSTTILLLATAQKKQKFQKIKHFLKEAEQLSRGPSKNRKGHLIIPSIEKIEKIRKETGKIIYLPHTIDCIKDWIEELNKEIDFFDGLNTGISILSLKTKVNFLATRTDELKASSKKKEQQKTLKEIKEIRLEFEQIVPKLRKKGLYIRYFPTTHLFSDTQSEIQAEILVFESWINMNKKILSTGKHQLFQAKGWIDLYKKMLSPQKPIDNSRLLKIQQALNRYQQKLKKIQSKFYENMESKLDDAKDVIDNSKNLEAWSKIDLPQNPSNKEKILLYQIEHIGNESKKIEKLSKEIEKTRDLSKLPEKVQALEKLKTPLRKKQKRCSVLILSRLKKLGIKNLETLKYSQIQKLKKTILAQIIQLYKCKEKFFQNGKGKGAYFLTPLEKSKAILKEKLKGNEEKKIQKTLENFIEVREHLKTLQNFEQSGFSKGEKPLKVKSKVYTAGQILKNLETLIKLIEYKKNIHRKTLIPSLGSLLHPKPLKQRGQA